VKRDWAVARAWLLCELNVERMFEPPESCLRRATVHGRHRVSAIPMAIEALKAAGCEW
jgi:hypothetical protein